MIYQGVAQKLPGARVHNQSLAEQVYHVLRESIATGRLRPGERILEKLLAGQLEVSRTPVREALLKLERDGLVICNSRRSYKVRVLSVTDVKEIYATLGILESAVVGLASTRLTPGDIQMLRNYNRQAERAARRADFRGYGAANREFHGVFLSKADNRTLRDVCESVRALLYTFPVRSKSLPKGLTRNVREHREIIRLAEAKDPKALESYFRDVHFDVEKNRRFIEDVFDRDGDAVV